MPCLLPVVMARLRKFVAYRRVERPYTRFSKYKSKNFIRARPVCRVVSFDMGDAKRKFPVTLNLVARDAVQVRDNAIESARMSANRYLEKTCGKDNYHFRCKLYPHHVLRENPLASGAGADRMSTGMKMSFGKAIGLACQIRKGKILFSASVPKEHVATAKTALKKASYKMPLKCGVEAAAKPMKKTAKKTATKAVKPPAKKAPANAANKT